MNIKADEELADLRRMAMLEIANAVREKGLTLTFLGEEKFILGVMFGMLIASERFIQVVGPELNEKIHEHLDKNYGDKL